MEERYADAQDGAGAVAGGGDDWKDNSGSGVTDSKKRARSPDDDGEGRMVSIINIIYSIHAEVFQGSARAH